MIIKNLNQSGQLLSLKETRKIKAGLVILKPQEEVGMHSTGSREEVVLVLDGEATLRYENEKDKVVAVNQLVYIPPNKKHNFINRGLQTVKYIYLVNKLD